MLKRIEELETENRFLKQWIDNLQKATDELIKRQPPPAIILKCTPEQLEQWVQSAPDAAAAPGAEPGVRDGDIHPYNDHQTITGDDPSAT